MKVIPLTQGKMARVDDEDYLRVAAVNWWADFRDNKWYARGYQKGIVIYLHRFVMDADPGMQIDHIDGDGLNCQKYNLRHATNQQNSSAFQRKRGTTSRFRGVSWYRRDSCWRAHITVGGKQRHLGYFEIEETAAHAYDSAARHCLGRFASPNFQQ